MIKNVLLKEWFEREKGPNTDVLKILGVEYAHIRLEDESDMYFTEYGLPFIDLLLPDKFYTDDEWFRNHSIRLPGTSNPFKVTTKKVDGHSKEIVFKWNRMGQDVPGASQLEELRTASFNSPFEEFALVMELNTALEKECNGVSIQRPLAIYVPAESVEDWETGRKQYKMRVKLQTHTEVELDMNRLYSVIYEWIPGIDAVCARSRGTIDDAQMRTLAKSAADLMEQKGFTVKDNKPQHVILSESISSATMNADNSMRYGLVDFELLMRTPEYESAIKKDRRREYLQRQRDRFMFEPACEFHPNLYHMNIFGVDYIYGHVESTRGRLWVVGKDPHLFDYFLPERWEGSLRTRISAYSQIYHTVTKDDIKLVWKVSRVGLRPDMDPFKEEENRILQYGCNSPFEEISLAMELSKKGIPTIYPRAIYMTGNRTEIFESLFDESRYRSHGSILTPDNVPILQMDRDYISIWGYWNGPDEKLANEDSDYCEGIDTLNAYREGIISKDMYFAIMFRERRKLASAGVEDLNLRGNHLLISIDQEKNIILDEEGLPEARISNFEFLRRIEFSQFGS